MGKDLSVNDLLFYRYGANRPAPRNRRACAQTLRAIREMQPRSVFCEVFVATLVLLGSLTMRLAVWVCSSASLPALPPQSRRSIRHEEFER